MTVEEAMDCTAEELGRNDFEAEQWIMLHYS